MVNSMDDLLLMEMRDVYDAENQLVKALPLMAKAASSEQLRAAFEQHLEETKHHVKRMEKAFQMLGHKAKGQTCAAMEGLVKEGSEMISQWGSNDVRDAGLIGCAQRVEHYEIAAYGCLRTWANQLGKFDVARLFEETLDEEKSCDAKLNSIAESKVNRQAAHA